MHIGFSFRVNFLARRLDASATCYRIALALVMLIGLLLGAPMAEAQQRAVVNQGTVGLIIDAAESSDTVLASDLAAALNDGYTMRLLPVLGQGSVRNVEDLLYLRGIDIALVQADVLDFYKRTGNEEDIQQRIRYVAKLADEEVHLLARRNVSTVQDLEGRRVNFGVDGSGSFLTAGRLFDHLGIDVDVTSFSLPAALKEIREGTIDALIVVGAAPIERLQLLEDDDGVHLLPLLTPGLGEPYGTGALDRGHYPALVASGEAVGTMTVAKVLTAFNWPSDHPRGAKVAKFVDSLFSNFDRLQRPPFHPKWRNVDLMAPMPGFQRLPAAATLIAESD